MAQFKAVALKARLKSDKTIRLKICIRHNGSRKYVDSGLTATIADLTKTMDIKTQHFKDSCEDIIRGYRAKCNANPDLVERMDCTQLVEFLTADPEPGEQEIDFLKFSNAEIARLKAAGRKGVATNHQTAINALLRFHKRPVLNVKDITAKFLTDFELFIRSKPLSDNNKSMVRAPSSYMASIRALHNALKMQYNDEDLGIIRVPFSPFNKYKLPTEKPTRKRALDAITINAIFNLADLPRMGNPRAIRFNLAKDCAILSFALIGMNSTDLFNCTEIKAGYITYKRMKTTTRRKDESVISVKVQPEILPLMEKYKDINRVFNFHTRFANEQAFNQSINKGLKEVGKLVGVDDLEFYAFRHSWATIGINDCKLNEYTVHTALNHANEQMKVTQIYIKKDWSIINDANRTVLDFVLKQSDPV